MKTAVKGIFITGTDTEVGKTFVSAALIHLLRQKGQRVSVLKPFECGQQTPSDSEILWQAAEGKGAIPKHICSYQFLEPLAPAMAAQKGQQTIDLERIDQDLEMAKREGDFLLVEGCGGLLVPLLPNHLHFSIESLASRFHLPVLIIARATLGTLNHTLLTLSRCQEKNLPVFGVLLNQTQKPNPHDLSLYENVPLLRSMTEIPIWGPLDFDPTISKRGFPHQPKMNPLIQKCLEPVLDALLNR